MAVPVQPMIDNNHPLFIHPSDTPSLSLISEKLTGSNGYVFWSRSKYISLLTKNKLGFIDGTCVKKNYEPILYQIWEICNVLIFGWIMNSASRELMTSRVYSTSVFHVWKDLCERFNKVNES